MELKTIGTKVKRLFDGGEDRGISPVIGVILMVAITVILAAVIGAFVLGLGGDLNSTPTATLSPSGDSSYAHAVDSTGDRVFAIDHKGGNELESDNLHVIVRDENGDPIARFSILNDEDGELKIVHVDGAGTELETVSTGDRVDVVDNTADDTTAPTDFGDGDELTIQIIHTPSDGEIASGTVVVG